MRTCPKCGEEVGAGARSCGLCGAEIGPGGRSMRPYLAGAAALVTIIAAAVALHSYFRPAVVRPPSDFLPDSTLAVVGVDVRPGSPTMLQVENSWSQEDREFLAARGVELAQRVVDWSGLQLDLGQEASGWFGGVVLAASIGGGRLRMLGPRSLVLVARATDLREARGDLEAAVEELAQAGGWRRSTARGPHAPITVWSRASGTTAMAYAAVDGCVVLSANEEVVRLCLESANGSAQRLSEAEGFRGASRSLPKTALVWGYASAPDMIRTTQRLVEALGTGWWGLARAFMGQDRAESSAAGETARGGLAFAVSPEKEGIRLHGAYWRGPGGAKGAGRAPAAEMLRLVPREAAGFTLVRGFDALAPAFLEDREGRPATPFGSPIRMLVQRESLPESVLLMVLPREGEERGLAVAAALMGGGSAVTAARLRTVLPKARSGKIGNAHVIAADQEALQQIEKAASDETARLELLTDADVVVQTWAEPAAFWPAMEKIGDLGFRVREDATGGKMDLYLKAEPRYLLGGGTRERTERGR